MDDDWEIQHFGNLSQTSAGDFDADGMTNGEEHLHGFNPSSQDDAFEDADGDRYPNVFEIRRGSDPNDSTSIPTPNYVVNSAGGGTHTTISAALNAANVQNGAYQIIGIAPGVYTGGPNLRDVTITSAKPKLLVIGLQGAGETVIDGGLANWGWIVGNSAVVSSLTFQKTWLALYVDAPAKEVRFVDLLVRDNATTSYATGVHVNSAARVHVVGSTFLNNTGATAAQQIWIGAGAGHLTNTVVSSQTSGTMLAKAPSATLSTNYCSVKGQTLSGTGNLAGTLDPKVRADGRPLWDSPLRGAGGTTTQSRIDMDGELRPTTNPDIGADQFIDSDSDELADKWEMDQAGDLTTLTSRSQDADGDGLTNEQEYVAYAKPTVADTDGDGLSDGDEVNLHGTSPLTTDTDGDDMPDAWEVAHGLSALTANGFEDADGDRYPNVFEYASSTDPSDRGSVPTPTYVVNGTGGGTHTTISAALNAANVQNGAYQIIGIAPGVYTGGPNLRDVTITSAKPKLLLIGLEGAAKTVIDGGLANYGWYLGNSVVISSLTFQKATVALYVNAPSKEMRFVDLLVRDNVGPSWAAGVHVDAAAKVDIVGSTFVNNTGASTAQQLWIGTGAGVLTNTVAWSQTSGTMLAKATSATLTTNHCLVKGQTLTGTGNLAGTVDPKLRSDARLLWDSPLRGAGGSVPQSRIDIDGELRPSSAPDIGVDQFNDSDGDGLADKWELDEAGDLTTLTSRSQDADGDGLTNEQEYAAYAKPTVADTDGDGLSDGDEVHLHGTSPLTTDTDGDDMPDAWEVAHGLSPITANGFDDDDGDRYPNVFEYAGSTDPSDRGSVPTPTYVVNGAGGGTHTTMSAALSAANVQNGAYQIIGIAPGVYTGGANLRDVTITSAKPKLLVIGLEGAEKTIIDGGSANWGWIVGNAAVVSSLTFRKTWLALYVDAPGKEVRFVDLLVRDNPLMTPLSWAGGVHVNAAAKVHVVGSTFLDNAGPAAAQQIWIGAGAAYLTNTVVWSQASGTMLAKAASATLTTNHCLVKGQTLAGTGNLAGTADPRLRSDARLLWDSPLRGAGGSVPQSRIDIDGELRPSNARDIGVDQFNDSDGDQLADKWELDEAGDLTTLTSRAQDADGDGLTNEQEYATHAKPTVADTDGDGLSDGDEVNLHGTSPLVIDTDGDDMPDAWEVAHGLSPLTVNGFEDADGDRYPNVFEYASSTDPTDRESVPTPTYVVNGAGGGTHTTISAALNAANVQNGAYQIIGIAPGVYTGGANLRDVTITSAKPKLLVIGLEGAGKTIIDGGSANWGWIVGNAAVVSSLTFRKTWLALYVDAPGKEVRFVDLLVRDSPLMNPPSWAGGVHVNAAAQVHILGSTFIDNKGATAAQQIWIGAGVGYLTNTVVWSQASGTMLAKATSATLTTNHCLVKGQTLTGTGNLAGGVDPKLRSDLRLRSDSPLRGAGGSVPQSRIDIDGEPRPSNAPDIGVDQFYDADSDGLPDAWEVANAGSTAATTGAADEDSDELSNTAEYDLETNWLDPDTDDDGVKDGVEVALGMNPFVADADDMESDLNQDGLIDSIGAQLGFQPNQTDSDGDSISNADEVLMCTNPLRADSDGDGVPDNADAFPFDPLMSSLSSNAQDVTPPVITLTAPWYAVEQ